MDSLEPLLTTYAYNILGSFEDARDIVQEAFLKFSLVDQEKVNDRKSYLVRTVINLSINEKRKQQKLRPVYPGEWLPEPVATERADAPINRKEVLSYSLMVLLEKLDARQRAVFILKEAFDYEHDEIANVLGISVENSRKLLSRARSRLQPQNRPAGVWLGEVNGRPHHYEVNEKQLAKYIHAIQNGDMPALERMLHEDITVISDGGGKAAASIRPVEGRKAVMALLLGLQKKFFQQIHMELRWVNHQPALYYYHEGQVILCEILTFSNGHIGKIYMMRNPDKLRWLEKNA